MQDGTRPAAGMFAPAESRLHSKIEGIALSSHTQVPPR
jgi:hypothetical protein